MNRPSEAPTPFVRLALGVAVAGALITVLAALARTHPAMGPDRHGIGVITMDDLHEGQVEVAAAMVLILTSAVLWGRLRRLPTKRHLLLFVALCVLAFDSLLSGLFTASFDSLSVNRFATWVTTWNGLLGGLLLLTASAIVDAPLTRPRRSIPASLLAGAVLLGALLATAWILRGWLPGAFATRPTTPEQLTFLSEHGLLFAIEVVTAGCWALAGAAFTVAASRTRDALTAWIGLGSVVASLSFVNYALFPSQFTELLYLGDMFFLLAVVMFLIGAVREVGAAEAALVDAAVNAERRRIAHELHDGVAQELSLIASQAHDMTRRPELAERGLERIRESVDRALDESRSAIKELSGPVGESLDSAIAATADVVARRTDVRIELDLEAAIVVPADVRVALMRITRAAVVLAARHGGARAVRVRLWRDHEVCLRISDDGSPLDVRSRSGRSELTAIRDRVGQISGRLDAHAGSSVGAVLEVRVPDPRGRPTLEP